MDIAIRIENLSKIYRLYEKPSDRLLESFSFRKKKRHNDYYALNNISLNIKKGEILGIVGTNGSGKSTILKIITGVLTPTSGNIEINGKISALLELGAGFNPEYTGIENIYLNGTMMGYTKAEVDEKLNDIIKFADIGDFINQPVTQPNNNIVNSVNNVDVISQPINSEINNPSINNNMYQEVSESISPVVEPENIPLEENYPPENNPSNVSGQPVPFDGQITTDENVNNMF